MDSRTALSRRASTSRLAATLLGALTCCAALAAPPTTPFDEMSVDRWAKLTEVERYQLNIAEKYYREQKWQVAADEYEKFQKQNERSEAVSFAQLKWSHCQVLLRKQNAAIKDGYQALIDYYPESPEAVAAAYLIGKTYKDTGDIKAAKKAYGKVLSSYPKNLVSVHARLDLIAIAAQEKDDERRLTLLKELTYNVDRKGDAAAPCLEAAHQLTHYSLTRGDFAEGLRALQSSYKEEAVPAHLMHPKVGRLPQILQEQTGQADEAVKARALKLADEAIVYLRSQVTANLTEHKAHAIQCWYYIADVQRDARRPEKQREVYEDMLKALGTDDQVLGHLGQWYKANGQAAQARTIYAKFKDATEGQRQVAASWMDEKKFDEAVGIYRKLALDDVQKAPYWLSHAAQAYRRGNKPDQALAVYRDLLNTDAKNADNYHWEIAQTQFDAHRWQEALTAYRGTERFPQNFKQMAECHRELKQYDDAIRLYLQIIAAHEPSGSWAQLQIAYTEEKAARKEKAISAFKLVCSRYPKTPEGSTAHEHLNRVYNIAVTLGGAKD